MTGDEKAPDSRLAAALVLFAAAAFSLLFRYHGLGGLDFWWSLALIVSVLSVTAFLGDPGFRESLSRDLRSSLPWKVGLGILSALLLYLVFWGGNHLSRWLFTFAGNNIETVYSLKGNVPGVRIVLLMAFIIGPGEELFWRGFLQRHLEARWGAFRGPGMVLFLYTAVHVSSLNMMLLIAAFVCGLFWGVLFQRFQSPLLNVVSHTLWDLLVFVFFPFTAALN